VLINVYTRYRKKDGNINNPASLGENFKARKLLNEFMKGAENFIVIGGDAAAAQQKFKRFLKYYYTPGGRQAKPREVKSGAEFGLSW